MKCGADVFMSEGQLTNPPHQKKSRIYNVSRHFWSCHVEKQSTKICAKGESGKLQVGQNFFCLETQQKVFFCQVAYVTDDKFCASELQMT